MFRTIRAKFAVGFFLIFSLSFLVLNLAVDQYIQRSNQKLIASDLIGLKNNSSVYVRQAFLINHYSNNDSYFGQMAEEMVNDLRRATSNDVSAYTVDGRLLYASDPLRFMDKPDEDFRLATEGKAAYTLMHRDSLGTVLFSYPVVVDGVKVGILRFSKDFSTLYEQSSQIRRLIFYIAIAIFAVAFLFSYLLSRHIAVPLVQLTRASTAVIQGNLDVRLSFRRKDEIGRLTNNFNVMIAQISKQIATIARDRDRLKMLNAQEKRFFDNVTHELKTPLTSILGYAEIIRENGESDKAFFVKGMRHIVEESRRLHSMVLNLLEVSRGSVGKVEAEPVELNTLLHDVCETMEMRAQRYKKHIRLALEPDLKVDGQADRLRQLFINLLDNAIKYSDPYSEIEVSARREALAVHFMFSNVGDTVPPDKLANVFKPFYAGERTAVEEGSIGLGLSIVKSIVEEHGGSIRMESVDRRTTVFVEIPEAEGGAMP
ncbi:Adaptive-response sensory-kinase SasA [Paenibacillus sp. CECT 9249]|uniref:sensor histidine kinase n=1 Tax=Paenibacillus sp. CECT 9249 TaxID=2845385 RepID=UPI001E284A53|nr:HAMP domain-containing sensor histidine kinase [Paenibacillus sp. CECT 9249]CAH0121656.1 Adaptive-response sensory-kinase SasA [Paenibacillus sp. CECT 9249]